MVIITTIYSKLKLQKMMVLFCAALWVILFAFLHVIVQVMS